MSTVTLQSRSKFPTRVKYSEGTLSIPPQGRSTGIEESLLGTVPDFITVIRLITVEEVVSQPKKVTFKNQKRK